jgi:hypothetical protein
VFQCLCDAVLCFHPGIMSLIAVLLAFGGQSAYQAAYCDVAHTMQFVTACMCACVCAADSCADGALQAAGGGGSREGAHSRCSAPQAGIQWPRCRQQRERRLPCDGSPRLRSSSSKQARERSKLQQLCSRPGQCWQQLPGASWGSGGRWGTSRRGVRHLFRHWAGVRRLAVQLSAGICGQPKGECIEWGCGRWDWQLHGCRQHQQLPQPDQGALAFWRGLQWWGVGCAVAWGQQYVQCCARGHGCAAAQLGC